jgi:hypothetical protein
MTQEVERIWQSAGVALQWGDHHSDAGWQADRVITVLVSDEVRGVRIPAGALGGVPVVDGRMRQMIYVLPSAVKALVSRAGASPGGEFAELYARMVGRVIAHELGHLLLDLFEHRSAGLMRRSFVSRDVRSADAARFSLTENDVALVHDRGAVAHGATAIVSASPAGDQPREDRLTGRRSARRR